MQTKTTSYLLFSILLLSSFTLQARHIIGGNLTYDCLGDGDYEFTLQMYRDCNCAQCAALDPIAFIAIYQCAANSNCTDLNQMSFLHRLDVPLDSTRLVEPNYVPCIISPDVCVEEGWYTFRLSDYGITLPGLEEESYHITYQRCCRNVTITNIIEPENSGATFTVEITPEAMAGCNNSPEFNFFPPTVICAGQPLEVDHSAFDQEGDSIVYEFCAPLLGGGPLLNASSYQTCEGANPNPACPPPYQAVNYILPTYGPSFPLGAGVLSIDPETGMITGTPTMLGQFVVGVCVKEYKDGVLIGTISRDFEFNVTNCETEVLVDIGEDVQIDPGDSVTLIALTNIPDGQFLWSTGDTSSSITVEEMGEYTVTVTSLTGCGGSDDVMVFFTTDIEEENLEHTIQIMPNPAKEQVHLDFATHLPLPLQVNILDINGKLLEQRIIQDHSMDLNIEQLPNGLYFLQINLSNTSVLKKLVKY